MDAATRILDAADELFAQIGFDGTTTREIAARAGVNKALIHYHYDSKDHLLERLLDRYYDELASTIAAAMTTPGGLRERFGALVDAHLAFLSTHHNFSRIVQREAAGGHHMDLIEARMTPLFTSAISVIDEEYPQASDAHLGAADLLTSFYAMVSAAFTYRGVLAHLLEGDPLGAESIQRRRRHLHTMLDLVFAALEATGKDQPPTHDGQPTRTEAHR